MSPNGRLPNAALATIGNGYVLERGAAAAHNAMAQETHRRWKRPVRVVAGYRTYDRQQYFWNLYQSGRGNLAARPGTSNHGLGLAVDLASQWDRWAVDQLGRSFGWSKSWSDAPSEWWHIKYATGHWQDVSRPKPRVLRYGMKGNDVRDMQIWLVRSGALTKAKPGQAPSIDGTYGRRTHGGLVLFQQQNKLKADGIAGPQTLGLLKKLYGAPWPRKK